MSSSVVETVPRAQDVLVTEDELTVSLVDGRRVSVPLAWFPRLLQASREQLKSYELSPFGLHWEELDEDVSIAGLLAGRGDQTRRMPKAAE